MSAGRCRCVGGSYGFEGDDPESSPVLGEGVVCEILDRDDGGLRVRCGTCGTLWRVEYMRYGGLYGDFYWRRLDPVPPAEGDR